MNDFFLTDLGDGRFILCGRFNLSNVAEALPTGHRDFNHYDNIIIDLDQADCASTAGVALLLEWSTWSRANGKRLSYANAPANLIALVKLNGVEELLKISPK